MGRGQLGAEVRGQEELLKPQSGPRPHGQGERLGPACLEDTQPPGRVEPWQERPPGVLGPPPGPWHPPGPSPQAPSPEFTRNPALLQPHCGQAAGSKAPPPGPCWRCTMCTHGWATTRLYSQGPSGSLQDSTGSPAPGTPEPGLLRWGGVVRLQSLTPQALGQFRLATPPLFSPAPEKVISPGKLLHLLRSTAGSQSCQELPPAFFFPYWPPSLSCRYCLCSRMACSNRGRFIPSTQVSTRAFTTEPPPEKHRQQETGTRRVGTHSAEAFQPFLLDWFPRPESDRAGMKDGLRDVGLVLFLSFCLV